MSLLEQDGSQVREGDIIAEKYRVERVLGRGGMGVVVSALHIHLDQRVALKFLLPEALQSPTVSERFAREARSAAKIHSEHVAKVLDVGTLPNGSPYMVMEYMDGEDLERVLGRHGPMPIELATDYVLQACEAVAEAHALGIVHRDLKPANLFLARRPSGPAIVKVLDFGISKAAGSTSQAQLTKTSSIMGSPLYMSPEQMTSAKNVDPRSDVWAIGIILYELLAGRTPFPAETMPELIAAVLQRSQDPLRTVRPDVPPVLEAAVHRCLEKDPARRFANVAELAAAIAPFAPARSSSISLERISHVLGVPARPSLLDASELAGPLSREPVVRAQTQAMTNAEWSRSAPAAATAPKRESTWAVFAVVGVVLAGGLVGVAALLHVRQPSEAANAPPSARDVGSANANPAVSSTGTSSAVASAPPASPAQPAPSAAADPPNPALAAAVAPLATPVTAPASPKPAAAAHSPVAAAPASQPAKPAASAAAPKCHVVSYPDIDGNMRFKQECR